MRKGGGNTNGGMDWNIINEYDVGEHGLGV
jgi:hypothetical protein